MKGVFQQNHVFQPESFSPFAFRFLDCAESVLGAVEGSIQFTLLRIEAECL